MKQIKTIICTFRTVHFIRFIPAVDLTVAFLLFFQARGRVAALKMRLEVANCKIIDIAMLLVFVNAFVTAIFLVGSVGTMHHAVTTFFLRDAHVSAVEGVVGTQQRFFDGGALVHPASGVQNLTEMGVYGTEAPAPRWVVSV